MPARLSSLPLGKEREYFLFNENSVNSAKGKQACWLLPVIGCDYDWSTGFVLSRVGCIICIWQHGSGEGNI